jgi:hypothetical protein
MQGMVTTQTLELLAWISSRPRTYAEAIEAWGTTCPRQSVWEDACSGGLVQVVRRQVSLTPLGRAVLDENRGLARAKAQVEG